MKITEEKMKELIDIVFPSHRCHSDIIHVGGRTDWLELKAIGFSNAFFIDGEFSVELYIFDDKSLDIDVYTDEYGLKDYGNNINDVIREITDAINNWMQYSRMHVDKKPHLSIHFDV